MSMFNQKEADMAIKALDTIDKQAKEGEAVLDAAEKQNNKFEEWIAEAERKGREEDEAKKKKDAALKEQVLKPVKEWKIVKTEPSKADASHFLSLGTLGSSTPPAANSYFGPLATLPSRIQNARISNGNAAQANDGFPTSWARMPSPFVTPPWKTRNSFADAQHKMPTLSTPPRTTRIAHKKSTAKGVDTNSQYPLSFVSQEPFGAADALKSPQQASSKADDAIKNTSSESSGPTIFTPEEKSDTSIDSILASAKQLVADLESTKARVDEMSIEIDKKNMTIRKTAVERQKLSQIVLEKEHEIKMLDERLDCEMKESFADHERITDLEKQLSDARAALAKKSEHENLVQTLAEKEHDIKVLKECIEYEHDQSSNDFVKIADPEEQLSVVKNSLAKKADEKKLKKLTEVINALDAEFGGIENARKLLKGPSFESLELILELFELETGKRLLSYVN